MQLFHHSFLAALHLREYQFHACCFDAITFALIYLSIDFCAAQQRLAWNTAAVQAGAAQFVHFDDDNRLSQLGRADRRHITSGSTAQYRHVTGYCHDMYPPVITHKFCITYYIVLSFMPITNL